MKDRNEHRPGYKKTGAGWIPEEWSCVQLLSVSTIERGRFSHRPRNAPQFYGGKHPFVQTGDVSGTQTYIRAYSQTLNNDGLAISKMFPAGTILMTIAANIGDCAILTFDSACPDSLVGINPNSTDIDTLFLNEYLNSIKRYRLYLAPRSAQHNINVETISKYHIPLPALPEQKKIAEILSTWDEAIEKTRRLIEAKKRLKKALMQQLLAGKKRLPGFNEKWESHRIGNLLKQIFRPVKFDDDATYHLISVRRRSEGIFYRGCIPGHIILTKKLYIALNGDFLISKMQIVHGASALVTKEFDGMHISGSYIALRAIDSKKLDIIFLNWLSKTRYFYHLTYLASYGVHIEKMTFNLLLFLKSQIKIPRNIKEQRLIAEIFSMADEEIDESINKLAVLEKQKRGLMQKLLTGEVRVKL